MIAAIQMVARYGYLPIMLVGLNGVALVLVSVGASPGWLLPLLTAGVVLSFGAERLLPYRGEWNLSHGDTGRDLAHALVNEAANFGTLLLLPVLSAVVSFEGAWPHGWPFAVQVLAAVLVLDAGITLAHFASHRVEALWRFHAVHHSVKRMYGFNGLMKHPLHQAIETGAGTLPLLLLGLPVGVATVLVFLVAIQLLLQHSNVDYRSGPLRLVLATNEVHRFHHQSDPALGDVNFGLFTTLVDHLLGTFHFEDRRRRFSSAELGVGGAPAYPQAYAAQLVAPFRPQARFRGRD